MHSFTQLKTTKGFTLIELLVGMGLSAIVLAGVLAVYVPVIKSWGTSTDLAEIHDTQSILYETLGLNIRQSGLLGCTEDPTKSKVIDGVTPPQSGRDNKIKGWAFGQVTGLVQPSFKAYAADDTSIENDLSNNLQNKRITSNGSNTGSGARIGDVFYALAPSEGYYRVSDVGAPNSDDKSLVLRSDLDTQFEIKQGNFYIINDCENAVVVRATADSNSGNSGIATLAYTNTVLNTYQHPRRTVVNPFRPALFYISAFQPNGSSTSIPTLYRRTVSTDDEPSIEDDAILTGVENIRIEFGVFARDDEGNPYVTDYYTIKNLPGAATMKDVSTVRVSVMIQSAGNNNATKQSSLIFPDLDGNLVDCFDSATPDTSACPEFVTSDDGRKKSHKVIQYAFALPRVEQISNKN